MAISDYESIRGATHGCALLVLWSEGESTAGDTGPALRDVYRKTRFSIHMGPDMHSHG
jgi:hypothetical protein